MRCLTAIANHVFQLKKNYFHFGMINRQEPITLLLNLVLYTVEATDYDHFGTRAF
jgi:hypothetical protein